MFASFLTGFNSDKNHDIPSPHQPRRQGIVAEGEPSTFPGWKLLQNQLMHFLPLHPGTKLQCESFTRQAMDLQNHRVSVIGNQVAITGHGWENSMLSNSSNWNDWLRIPLPGALYFGDTPRNSCSTSQIRKPNSQSSLWGMRTHAVIITIPNFGFRLYYHLARYETLIHASGVSKIWLYDKHW